MYQGLPYLFRRRDHFREEDEITRNRHVTGEAGARHNVSTIVEGRAENATNFDVVNMSLDEELMCQNQGNEPPTNFDAVDMSLDEELMCQNQGNKPPIRQDYEPQFLRQDYGPPQFLQTNESQMRSQNNEQADSFRMLAQAINNLGGSNNDTKVGKGSVNKPQNFAGRITEDFEDFLRHFEGYALFNNWKNDHKCRALPNFLTSVAFDFFFSLDQDIRSDYHTVIAKMRQKFNPNELQLVKNQELYTRCQQPNEPLENYIETVLRLCTRAGKKPEDHLVGFIHGLRTGLKTFVMSQNVANLEQAMNAARLGDSLYPEVQVQLQPKVNVVECNSLEKKVDELCKTLSALIESQKPKQNSGGSGGNPRNYRNARSTNGDPICGRCNRLGHTATYCRTQLPQNRPRQQGDKPGDKVSPVGVESDNGARSQVKCRSCGKSGHVAKECRTFPPVCFNCQKTGHIMKDCWHLQQNAEPSNL